MSVPTGPIPFDHYRADLVEAAFVESARRARAAIESIPLAEPTFANTFGALDAATRDTDYWFAIAEHLDEVLGTPELRATYERVHASRTALASEIATSEPLFAALEAFARGDAARELDAVEVRFVDKTLRTFVRGGARLDAPARKRLAAIDARLGECAVAFVARVDDALRRSAELVLDAGRLGGLPDHVVDEAGRAARDRGEPGFLFTLSGPTYSAVLELADDRELRRALYRRRTTLASENGPLVSEMLALRAEKASLLGFASFADLATADRLMRSGAAARAFVDSVLDALAPSFARETDELAAYAASLGAPPLAAWDVAYYAEKLRREREGLDPEVLRPYFPIDRVLGGLFELIERLFGLRVEPIPDAPVWHPDVRVISVEDRGESIGLIYLDLYCRAGKREGAWMTPVLDRIGGHAIAILATDLTAPAPGTVATLTHREVVRLFHEMGHGLHHVLSEVPLRGLAGTRVAWDVVELASGIFECLAWDAEVLDRISANVRTGEPMPAALRDRWLSARRFRAVSELVRELGLAATDLELHARSATASALAPSEVLELARELAARTSPAPLPAEHAALWSFSHVFGSGSGYEACFYSYPLADVLSAQVIERLSTEGLVTTRAGRVLREVLLARGDAADPLDVFRELAGRDPDPSALLARMRG